MGVSPGFHHRNPRGSPVPLRRSSLPSGRRSQGLLRGHARQELPNFPQQFCSAEAWWYPNRKIQKAHDFKGFKGMFNDLWWFLCFCPGFKGKHLVVSYNALWYIYILVLWLQEQVSWFGFTLSWRFTRNAEVSHDDFVRVFAQVSKIYPDIYVSLPQSFHDASFVSIKQMRIPIGSMYGIYANIGGILKVNVTIYGIHGSYGIWHSSINDGWVLYSDRRWLMMVFEMIGDENTTGNPHKVRLPSSVCWSNR